MLKMNFYPVFISMLPLNKRLQVDSNVKQGNIEILNNIEMSNNIEIEKMPVTGL